MGIAAILLYGAIIGLGVGIGVVTVTAAAAALYYLARAILRALWRCL